MGTGNSNGVDITTLVCVTRELYALLSPPKKAEINKNVLPSNGSVVPVLDPTVDGMKSWTIKNTGSLPLSLWYFKADIVPVQVETLAAGQKISSATAPRAIYVAGGNGDTTAGYEFVAWY